MVFKDVDSYLARLFNNQPYMNLQPEDREKAVFEAQEMLTDDFPISKLTPRAVGLQVMFMMEGEEESLARLARLGVTSYSNKGVSVTFNGSNISPAVMKILHKGYGKKRFGWLV